MRRVVLGLAMAALGTGVAAGQEARRTANDAWCTDRDGDPDFARHCEVREVALPAAGRLAVDAEPNGGIQVSAWDGAGIRVVARVTAHAKDEAEARRLAAAVRVLTDGTVRAEGPQPSGRRSWWSVSYRIQAPAHTDLDLRTMNGGIRLEGLRGSSEFRTTNGGISLTDVGGSVHGQTTNGGVMVTLTGDRWDGEGLDVETTNGGVTLNVPEGYNAQLETGTVNGGIDLRFPVEVKGRLDKSLSTQLGSGGPRVRATTTNGGVVVRRRS